MSREEELRNLLSGDVDPAKLTDEELESRINLLKEQSTSRRDVDRGSVERFFDQKFPAYGIVARGEDSKLPAIKKILVDFASQNLRMPDIGEFRDLVFKNKLNPDDVLRQGPLINFINDQNARNQVASLTGEMAGPPAEAKERLKPLEELLSSRQREAKTNKSVQDYVSGLQDELSKGTEQFVQSQKQVLEKQFQEQVAPDILQTLNQRGLAFGGDLPSELLSAASSLFGGLEQEHADLLAQDLSFFQDAGYREQLRLVINKGGDIAGILSGERQSALDAQENRFKGSETALTRNAQQDMFMRQMQRAIQIQQQTLSRQSDLQTQASRRSLYGGFGNAGGALAGAYLGSAGGPLGVAIGAGVGGAAGGNLGGLFG